MRVGIFGGAFDPPHRGHQKALAAFIEKANLDLCYVIPSGRAPHKVISDGATNEDRLAMARLAFEPLSAKVSVSDEEIRKEGVSYSYETVQNVAEKHPDAKLYLFVGTDQFLAFETWKNPAFILERVTLCVMERYGEKNALLEKKSALEKEFGARLLLLEEKAYIISSTQIREELAEKGYSDSLCPQVNEYIAVEGIYSATSEERKKILLDLKKILSPDRFSHTLGVERETNRLAELFGMNHRSALRLAALFHDRTKEWTEKEQVSFLEQEGEFISEDDLKSPAVLHGRSAALLAKKEGLDENFVSAIRYHTTGRESMTLEEKILFFADYIEETRKHEVCRAMRERFYQNLGSDPKTHLDSCILKVLEDTMAHLNEKELPIHPLTQKALEDLKQKGIKMTAQEKAIKIATVLDEKKGRDVKILKVREETVITDFFVIATATSSTHLKALCDEVEYRLREEDGEVVNRTEGYGGGGWILADYGDVIVHIFDAEGRDFFKLEKLWNGAEPIEFEQKED